MRILILGGDGMLGHQLLAQLAPRHDCRVTLRRPLDDYASFGLFRPQQRLRRHRASYHRRAPPYTRPLQTRGGRQCCGNRETAAHRRGGDPEPGDQRVAAAPARPRLRWDRRPPRPHEHRLRVFRPQGKLYGDRPRGCRGSLRPDQVARRGARPELHHAAHVDHRPGARAEDRACSNGSSRSSGTRSRLPQGDLLRVHDHRDGAHHRDAARRVSRMQPASTTCRASRSASTSC